MRSPASWPTSSSHVALRHGTAQATKGEKFQIGAIAGQILGAVVGGTAGSIIAQGSNFGLSTYFLKYSREYESQADILGAQMLARAGYNPIEMANMFKTLEAEGGSGDAAVPERPPEPGEPIPGDRQRGEVAAGERQLQHRPVPADPGEAEAGRPVVHRAGDRRGQGARTIRRTGAPARPVAPPTCASSRPRRRMRTYRPTNFMQVSVPSNWSQVNDNSGVTYAPQGAFFDTQGGTAFTHGIEFGMAQGGGRNLQRDTQSLLNKFAQSNPELRLQGNYNRVDVNGRPGLVAQLSNRSEVTGQQEFIQLTTTYLSDGSMLYMIGVAPQNEANTYNSAFNRVRQTLRLAD